jgi:hypothetical protein
LKFDDKPINVRYLTTLKARNRIRRIMQLARPGPGIVGFIRQAFERSIVSFLISFGRFGRSSIGLLFVVFSATT